MAVPLITTFKMENMESSEIIVVSPDISKTITKPANSASKCPTPHCPKYYKQAYRTSWETLPEFKGWLKGVEGQPSRAFCSYCQVTLFAHRLSLLKHTCTRKHQKASHNIFLQHPTKVTNAEADSENIGTDKEIEEIEPLADTQGEEDEDMEPKTTNSVVTQNDFKIETVSTMGLVESPKNSQLRLKPKGQPGSGMTVTIIREDGTRDPMHLKVTHFQDNATSSSLVPANFVETEFKSVEQSKGNANHTEEESAMAPSATSPLTTHVLDTSKGAPVHGIKVSLYRLIEGRWTLVNESVTSPDGRCSELIEKANFVSGRYKLHFDVDRYFELQRQESMYPFVEIVFDVHAPQTHYHIPLLISPYGYTTYRGS